MTTTIGSVSSGTLRTEDLLNAFAGELERILRVGDPSASQRLTHERLIRDARDADPESDDAEELADRLITALDEYAPDCCYFGTHPGDGADFGYWISDDAIRDGIHDREIVRASDLPSYLYHVNDHGNATLYRVTLEEVWSVV